MFCEHCGHEVRGTPSHCPYCGADLHQELWEEVRRSQRRPNFLAFGCSCLLLVLIAALMGAAVGSVVLYFVDWWLPSYPEHLPALLGALSLTVGFAVGLLLAVHRFLHGRPGRPW